MNSPEAERVKKITDILREEYPDTRPQLDFTNPFELLISTILSAQCTDARVNIVTNELFQKYRQPSDYIAVPAEELEKDIYSTGFYKQKTKSIRNCCRELIEKFNGEVPADFVKLNALPGVGRKTASVVAGNAFGIPAIAVDTHVKRISNLLGFVNDKSPEKIEFKLKEILPESDWIDFTHWLISHGRKICSARKPKCWECPISEYCPSSKKTNE